MNQKLPEIKYTPDSLFRDPRKLFRSMWTDLFLSRELAWRLFLRNVSAKYRKTLLGYIWVFLPPVFTTIVFVFLNSQNIISVKKVNIPYPAFALIGMLFWQLFTDALSSPLKIINKSKSFLVKVYFPREALIIAGLYEVIFNFMIRLTLLVVVFIWYDLKFLPSIFLVPIAVLAIISTGLLFGTLLAPIGALYEDIEQSIPIVTSAWLFLTPVVYPPPTTWPISLLYTLNPVSPLLVTAREMITTGSFSQLGMFFLVFTLTFALLFGAWILYRASLPHIIERMSV